MDALINLGFFLFAIILAFNVGGLIERRHYRAIEKEEEALLDLPVVTSRNLTDDEDYQEACLVTGSVVISLDYFKRFLADLRNIFGGRVSAYETLLDRGRREAILRMKKQARAWGAEIIINTRVETSTISSITNQNPNGLGCFEVLAFGTALKRGSPG